MHRRRPLLVGLPCVEKFVVEAARTEVVLVLRFPLVLPPRETVVGDACAQLHVEEGSEAPQVAAELGLGAQRDGAVVVVIAEGRLAVPNPLTRGRRRGISHEPADAEVVGAIEVAHRRSLGRPACGEDSARHGILHPLARHLGEGSALPIGPPPAIAVIDHAPPVGRPHVVDPMARHAEAHRIALRCRHVIVEVVAAAEIPGHAPFDRATVFQNDGVLRFAGEQTRENRGQK